MQSIIINFLVAAAVAAGLVAAVLHWGFGALFV
mgnify:FL=1